MEEESKPPSVPPTESITNSIQLDAPTPMAGVDAPSPELVEMLKRQLAQQTTQIAQLRAKADAHDTGKHEMCKKVQPDGLAYLTDHVSKQVTPENQQYVDILLNRARNMHAVSNEKLDDEMPYAVLLDCASATHRTATKREREATESSEALKNAMQQKEVYESENNKLQKQLNEQISLNEERLAQSEEMAYKLAQVTGVAQRYNFQNPASRTIQRPVDPPLPKQTETNAPATLATGMNASEMKMEAPGAVGLTSTLNVASGKLPMRAASFLDKLRASGPGNSKFLPTDAIRSVIGGKDEGPPGGSKGGAGPSAELINAIAGGSSF